MFSQKPCYFSQLSRTYPVLRLVDVCDRQSFIRTHVLDNIYICILMYVLFYAALWYATNIIKRIEKSNLEISTTVASNKTKLDRLMLLRNKKTQFEEVIVKTTDAQKVTTKYLEDEMCRLDTELITTSSKIARLEKIIEKMVFSTNIRTNHSRVQSVSSQPARMNIQGVSSKASRIRSKTSRSSSRHFRRHCRQNRRLASTGSLSADLLDNGERRSRLHLPRLPHRKSDSSNSASAEASSESVVQCRKRISIMAAFIFPSLPTCVIMEENVRIARKLADHSRVENDESKAKRAVR